MDMRHDLNDLFRERFQGHEAPVPSGTWQGIQAQMAANAPVEEGGDKVADLFRERFHGHELAVDPAVWQGISSQLGHVATGTTAAAGVWGWVAAGVAAVTISAGVYLSLATDPVQEAVSARTVAELPATPEQDPARSGVVIASSDAPEAHQDAGSIIREPVQALPNNTAITEQPGSGQPNGAVAPDIAPAELPVSNPSSPTPVVPELIAPVENPMLVEAIVSEMTAKADAAVEAEKESRVQDPLLDDTGSLGEEAIDQPEPSDRPRLFLQNTFTPNGDGVNDEYEVTGGGRFAQVLMRVYAVKDNRLVFSTDANEPWRGAGCETGYYLVAVEAVTHEGRLITEGKVVWLNRQ